MFGDVELWSYRYTLFAAVCAVRFTQRLMGTVCNFRRSSLRSGRAVDSPVWISAEWVIQEKIPGAVLAPTMHLNAVVMHFDPLPVLVFPGDQPLGASHGKITRHRDVMGHDIHVRLHIDVGRHGRANCVTTASNRCAS